MKGEKAQQVSLPRPRDDFPMLAGHAAAASCLSHPSQPHCSFTTHTSCWPCPLSSQEEAPEQNLASLSPAITLAERAAHVVGRYERASALEQPYTCIDVACMLRLPCYGTVYGAVHVVLCELSERL